MPPSLKEFYWGRVVLITGHSGFKGSWLSIWLRELGAQVIGYSLDPPTTPSLFETCDLKHRVTSRIGDVRDLESLLKVMNKHNPDIVFHMAAQSLVRRSYQYPVETYGTNVMGTVNVLEAGRLTPSVRTIVNVTSDKCYENKEWIWGYRENDPVGGHDPYSSSKGCSELVTKAYAQSYFKAGERHHPPKSLSSVRAGNVIGGGDWAQDRLIPDCVRALAARRPIIIRNPDAVRPWQHVLEPLYGYLLLAKRMSDEPAGFSGAWNFGSTDGSLLTVSEMVRQVVEEWGEGSCDVCPDPLLHEAQVLKLDSLKARTFLGWKSRWDVRTSISKTVEWYKHNLAGNDMYEISKRQIADYSEGC
jgi:CDP-glucose 4,6-dehydratase